MKQGGRGSTRIEKEQQAANINLECRAQTGFDIQPRRYLNILSAYFVWLPNSTNLSMARD